MKKGDELKERTKAFALRVMNLIDALPKSTKGRAIASQLVRSGTSVAANYRAVCRARSKAEFIAKIGIVVEEADETLFWLELLVETRIVTEARMRSLMREANELLAIFAASQYTTRRRRPMNQ